MTTQQLELASVDEWIAREGISFSADADGDFDAAVARYG